MEALIMFSTLRPVRTFAGSLLLVSLLSACEITNVWHFVNDPDLLSHPTPRHSAVSRNHEFLLAQQGLTDSLELFGTQGIHLDSVALPEEWRSVANATYRGPPIEVNGRDVGAEAFLVLHRNGWVIPWYPRRGQLMTAPLDYWIKLPAEKHGVLSRAMRDIDQHEDGTIYVLTTVAHEVQWSHGRLFQRSPLGVWSYVDKGADDTLLYKVKAVAVDKQTGKVAVASEPLGHRAHFDLYEIDLTPDTQHIREQTRSLVDMDYFLGHFYLGVNTVQGPGDYPYKIEIRNPAWAVTHERNVFRVESLSLDLPPLPVSAKGYNKTYLWSTGSDENAGDGEFYFVHQYEIRP